MRTPFARAWALLWSEREIEEGAGAPAHWHDRLAAQFGYPRLSCQITVTHDMLVRLVTDKRIWGRRDPTRRWPPQEGA